MTSAVGGKVARQNLHLLEQQPGGAEVVSLREHRRKIPLALPFMDDENNFDGMTYTSMFSCGDPAFRRFHEFSGQPLSGGQEAMHNESKQQPGPAALLAQVGHGKSRTK